MDKEFKSQRWHVDFPDAGTESFATRKVAEETAEAWFGMFYLCDCENRECKFFIQDF